MLYLWRPEFASALRLVPHHLSCYHIDDEYSFRDVECADVGNGASAAETGRAGVHPLGHHVAAKGGINPHTSHIPNGVDYARYSRRCRSRTICATIPRPRVGYCGWLKPQINWGVLQALAERHADMVVRLRRCQKRQPEVADNVARLRRLPNVHILGGRPTAVLHGYIQHFDVCLMPYKSNWYTQFIYPVKVHEYLASGSPVVASPLPNLREFAERRGVCRRRGGMVGRHCSGAGHP